MKNVLRVIAFDLFGTLARSAYSGPKWYELLEKHLYGYSAEYVAAVIRGLAMNSHPMNQCMSDTRMFCDEPSDEAGERSEYMQIIGERLGFAFDVPSAAYNAGVSPEYVKSLPAVAIEQLVNCWKSENDAIEWLEGAESVILSLQDPQTAVVLISNITVVGMWSVIDNLGPLIQRFDKTYFSCNNPASKPDPYMWQLVMKNYQASEYWMIGDDPLIDLVMPAAMGWKTILVCDSVSLKDVPKIIRGEK